MKDVELAWKNMHPMKQIQPHLNSEYLPLSQYPRRHDFVACLLYWWNAHSFSWFGAQAFLCEEFSSDSPWKTNFAVYLTAHDFQWSRPMIRERFKNLTTTGLQMINVYPPFDYSAPNLLLVAVSVLLNRPPVSAQRLTPPFQAIKMTTLGRPGLAVGISSVPSKLDVRDIDGNAWNRFISVRNAF